MSLRLIAGAVVGGTALVGGAVYALCEFFREKRCILLEGNVEAGKTTIVRCLKGEPFKAEYTSTPNTDTDSVETEIGEWTLYDAGGSKSLYAIKEKARHKAKEDFDKVAYIYVFDAEKCRQSVPMEILYGARNCGQEANEWGFKALAIGTRADKLSNESCLKIVNEIRQYANIPCEIFDMTQSPREPIAKFIDGSTQ
ncbi:MAG: hypothetical protein HDT12_00945 [Helicobacter sp.]|nr:hypothetical protein [Helicobacter sp.]